MHDGPILIVGAGYCGQFAAQKWADEGRTVYATTRSTEKAEELEESGLIALRLDLSRELNALPVVEFPDAPVAIVSVPPDRSDEARSQEARLAEWLLRHRVRRVLYWSATSVYPNQDGSEVDDDSPTGPDSERGRRREAAETVLRDELAKASGVFESMRLVGIYGPHRTIRRRIEQGAYRFPGDGRTVSNRIHRDDVVSATEHILGLEPSTREWVVSDGEPFEVIEMIRFVCRENELPMPPSVPMSEIPERTRSFWLGNRRVHPKRLFETGWTPKYANFRQGLLASWREEDDPERLFAD